MTKKINMKIGSKETLEFNFWSDEALYSKRYMAYGLGSLYISNKKIWPPEEERLLWSWFDLLGYFANNWFHLCYENCYPFPSRLKMKQSMKFNRPWDFGKFILETHTDSELSESEIDKEERDVISFEERHDLSSGMVGIQLPSVYFMREDSDFGIYWGDGSDEMCHLPAQDVIETLMRTGDFISNWMSSFPEKCEYAKIIVDQWNDVKQHDKQLDMKF